MSNPSNHQHQERDYEDKDIPLKPILVALFLTAIFTAVVFFAIRFMMAKFEHQTAQLDQPSSKFATERLLPPAPLLQVDEKRTWDEQQVLNAKQLHDYGWVDKSAGIVQVPIERAMQMVVEKGLPARSADTK